MKKILIWGCGEMCKKMLSEGVFNEVEIVGFIDKNDELKSFYNLKVYNLNTNNFNKIDYDFILVTPENHQVIIDILFVLSNSNIDSSKVLFIHHTILLSTLITQNINSFKKVSNKLYKYVCDYNELNIINVSHRCSYDLIDNEKNISPTNINFDESIYMKDYARYRTFELVANEIKRCNVVGEVAEVGVFRGTFAKLINKVFNDRKLYLFDTFTSFDDDEFKEDVEKGYCSDDFKEAFKNTSVDLVLNNMIYPENCIIRQGYFPDSLEKDDRDLGFAFVSIDVDLYKPIYNCLDFFYPRLNENGYLFIHDYNLHMLGGVKEAVLKYENDNGIILKKFPIADNSGTLVIIK